MCIITYSPSITQFVDTDVIEKVLQLLRWRCSSKNMLLLEELEHSFLNHKQEFAVCLTYSK